MFIELRRRFRDFVKWHIVIPVDLWISDRQVVAALDQRDRDAPAGQ